MSRTQQTRSAMRRAWRVFGAREGRRIEMEVCLSRAPLCPCCGGVLEAQAGSRLRRRLPLDARAYDLDCRECRRFWSVVRHTERSIHLVRMRRFVAALRAVELEVARPAGDAALLA